MSTDPNQNGFQNGTSPDLPSMAEQGQMLGMAWLNDYQQKLACQRLAYANACGVPLAPGSGAGIAITTNHFAPPDAPPTAQSPPQTGSQPNAGSGLSGLAKAGIVAAAVAGTGGLGAGLAALLSPSPAPNTTIVQPVQQAADGQVTIGINDDGTLYDPNQPTPQK